MHLPPLKDPPRSCSSLDPSPSQRGFSGFSRPNTHHLVQLSNKNLPIPNATSFRRTSDGLNHPRYLRVRHSDLDFHLGDKFNRILLASIRFLMAFLTPKPFDFRYGHPLNTDFQQGIFNLFQFKRFDDGFNQFHVDASLPNQLTNHRHLSDRRGSYAQLTG